MSEWTAEAIKGLRNAMGLSQEGFCKEVGVSFRTVWNWENGVTEPSQLARQRLKKVSDSFMRSQVC